MSAASVTLLAVVAASGAYIGPAGATSESAGNQLAGTWTVTVNRPPPLPAVSSLQVYTAQGSMIESGNDGASRSPQYASWERVRGREYAATGLFFRFDPQSGAFLGRMKINRTIELAQDGQSFTFRGSSTVLNANGSVGVTIPSTGSGELDYGGAPSRIERSTVPHIRTSGGSL